MEQENNIGRRIITSIVATILLLLTIFGITYAYFIAKVKGNTSIKSADVSAGRLELLYEDGNGLIELLKIKPGIILESKTFSVTNTGTKDIEDYDVILEDVINELTYTTDLIYNLTCTSSKGTCNGVSNSEFPTTNSKLITNSIDVGETQTYTITVSYIETNTDQSEDMKKTVSARINILDEDYYYNVDNLIIYGNSIQNGTPSSTNPINIEGVGNKSKNLLDLYNRTEGTLSGWSNVTARNFDYDKYYDGLTTNNYYSPQSIITASIIGDNWVILSKSSGYGVAFPIKVKSNTTYTVSGFSGSGDDFIGIGYYDSEGNNISNFTSTNETFSFTTPENCVTATVILRPSPNVEIMYKNIQVEEGPVATEYIPYNKYSIPLFISRKNLWDEKWELGYYNNSTGAPLKSNNRIRGKNYIPVSPNSSIFISCGSGNKLVVHAYDINKNFIGTYYNNSWVKGTSSTDVGNHAITIPENGYYIKISANVLYGSSYNNDIIVMNNSIEDKTYESFQGINTSIILDEPLRKIGNYVDYIDFKKGKVIRNVEVIDNTGTLSLSDSLRGLSKPVEESITLPKIGLLNSINNISIGTTVQPSKIQTR